MTAVDIVAIELLRFSLPFVAPIRTSYGEERSREGTLVRAITADGVEGWGECAALARPDYHFETADGAYAVLCGELAPAALAGEALPFDNPMARCALDLAVLDAELRTSGASLATHLGGARSRVAACAAIGIATSVGALLEEVDRVVAAGYHRIKLKIAPGWDVEPVAAVRHEHADLAIVVDANGAYAPDDVAELRSLRRYGLQQVEQPFAADALEAHAALARDLFTPICLDESITSIAAAMDATERGACNIVGVKAARLGGYGEAKRLHDLCLERGIAVWCGGMYDAGIGRAANLALASLPGFVFGGDLAASDRYFARDVTEPFVLDRDGLLAVPDGPGIGVTPDPAVLADVVLYRAMIRR